MRLTDLLRGAGIDAADLATASSVEVHDVSLSSSTVLPGSVFAALPGHRTHGATYALDAISAGAVAIVTDPAGARMIGTVDVPIIVLDEPRSALARLAATLWDHPSTDMTMIGVTGTNGKTSVTHLIQAALVRNGIPCAVIGTLGTLFDGLDGSSHPRTTPEAPDLQATLATVRDAGAAAVAMEVSSIAVCEHRVDSIAFDIAVFTGLTHDHLDYHGTMQSYFEAKADLFEPSRASSGVVMIDDEWGRSLKERARIPITTVSATGAAADWRARIDGDRVSIEGLDTAVVHLPVPTGFAVANLALSVAVAHALHIPAQLAADAAVSARIPGRMELVRSTGGVAFVVDYAHTPDAIRQVVTACSGLRAERQGRVIVVLGAGGDRDSTKRSDMGHAASGADIVIVTDDNPRSEDPAAIRSAVLAGVRGSGCEVTEVADRREAIAFAVQTAQSGDIVLVLGKGHETTQEFADHVLAFDDRSVLAFFVEERFGGVEEGGRT